ncbi:DUF262 domain-containing protein [Acidovorax sp. sic0104]|uniref:DUF262 domain-containing protein n=1 Tax=Acidovorax sp. sic0104 TaxID=2854784 RepID=UPI001C4474CD|nr:DUF262 domain-containing protein [Acidovorax sp. sic0104]MBV7542004.1 DUF262 domain-containing protein [Acidovorax sp. sic0104]
MSKPPCGLSNEYWDSLSPRSKELYDLIKPLAEPAYTVDWHLGGLEKTLSDLEESVVSMGGTLELLPDFQRGHVWTESQRSAFIEYMLRNMSPGRILFNCPEWTRPSDQKGDIKPFTMQCLDGVQRLTAVRKFLADQVTVFGGIVASDLRDTPFNPFRMNYRLQVGVYEFNTRKELLQTYLSINRGGTPHSDDEIARVQGLLAQASAT